MAALENFFVTSFHSEISGGAVVQGLGVDSPEDFVNVSKETSRFCSICGSLNAYSVSDVASSWRFSELLSFVVSAFETV